MTFKGRAQFNEATFEGAAAFGGVGFEGEALFEEATFKELCFILGSEISRT